MYREHTVGVVVPAYNEAGFVGEVIETLPEFVDRVYAVDDCSTDGTWAEIQQAAGLEPASAGPDAASDDGAHSSEAPASDRSAPLEDTGASDSGTVPDGDAPLDASRAEVDLQGSHGTHASDADRPSGATSGDELTDGSGGGTGVLASDEQQDSATERREDSGTERRDGSAAERRNDSAAERRRDAATDRDAQGTTLEQSDRVVPIRHEENRGVGGAIKTGYQRARDDEMDVTVVVGADGQMDPDRMSSLVDPIVEGKAEYAKGNRLLNPDHHEEMPRHRVVGNGVLTLLTRIATGYWQIGDPQMGYTAISLEALEDADVDGMYEYYGYCNDLLVRLSTADVRVADVPCPLHYGDEESHISYSSYVPRVSSMLLGSFLRRLWSEKGSAAGATRLGLFVGGAAAVAAGVLGVVVGAVRRAVASETAASETADDSETDGRAETGAASGSDAAPEDGDEPAFAVELDGTAGREAVSDRRAADRHEVSKPGLAATDADATADGDATTNDDVPAGGNEAADGDAVADGDAAVDTAADSTAPVERPAGPSCRSKLAIVGGVAALLGAMLIDATTNATKNYTDRLPEESE